MAAKAKKDTGKKKKKRVGGLHGSYPKPTTWTIRLADSEVATIKRTCGIDTIMVKCKVPVTRILKGPGSVSIETKYINARTAKGAFIKAPMEVDALYLTLTIGKKKYIGRACCKPPDVFSVRQGTKQAAKHLFEKIGRDNEDITHTDRQRIMRMICPFCFSKKELAADAAPDLFSSLDGEQKPKKAAKKKVVLPATDSADLPAGHA